MSQLIIYDDHAPGEEILKSEDFETIRASLSSVGVAFERWTADREIAIDAEPDEVLDVYRGEIDRLMAERGYQTCDVVSMHARHPEKSVLRRKFLSEHTHSEDEVRFFVRGQGLFVIHADGRVFSMLCTREDLISVPAHTRHWFDMGSSPEFTCIRLFNDPSGWVADFTGDPIAERFPGLA